MKLYHRPGAGRPGRVRWALEEAGIAYELCVLSAEECQGEEHAARQPLNRVPVLDDGEGTIFESAAIVLHIADLGGQALTFAPSTHERALVYQWVLFNMTEIEPPFLEAHLVPGSSEQRRGDAVRQLQRAQAVVERALDGRSHLVGDRFTVADLVVVDTLLIGRAFIGAEYSPALEAYIAEHAGRPARAKADELLAPG